MVGKPRSGEPSAARLGQIWCQRALLWTADLPPVASAHRVAFNRESERLRCLAMAGLIGSTT